MPPRLSILIVNWNTQTYLEACLRSLQDNLPGLPHQTIVVDNASTDGSATLVRERFPEVTLLAQQTNLGFAAANNLALQQATGEVIWLLNPDTEVMPGCAQEMLTFLAAHPRAGAVASALIDARDGSIQRSCRTFPRPAALWAEATGLAAAFPRSKRLGFYKMGWWNYRDARPVDQPMASSFMVRRATIQACGGLFDEQFPIFFNDVDLCQRIWRTGAQIWYLPEARVRHWGGASTRQVKVAMIKESHRCLRLYYAKHYRGIVAPPLYCSTLVMMEAAGKFRAWRAGRHAAKA